MEIAKGIYNSNYEDLNLVDLQNEDWSIAIDYLEKRLIERYIEPIEILIDAEKDKTAKDKKFGFTILAIDCLLAETIQSFYEGEIDSKGKSKAIFVRFLRKRDNFQKHFQTDKDASKFYENFRCGILHQGQTFGDTKIWAIGQLIQKQGNYIVINRVEFHNKIKEELNLYIAELRKKQNSTLMVNFKRKMDFICGV